MAKKTQVLLNPLADPNQITPSSADSVSAKLESELRLYGGLLIQQAGVRLKLPQVVMATAATLFQRFYFVTSFLHFGIRDVSAGSLFLASKLEEKPIRIRDLINVYDYLLQVINWSRDQLELNDKEVDEDRTSDEALREARAKIESNPLLPQNIKISMLKHLEKKKAESSQSTSKISKVSSSSSSSSIARNDKNNGNKENKLVKLDLKDFKYKPMCYYSQSFYDRKEEIVVAEMQILKRLGFRVQVQHPYSAMVNYLRVLDLTNDDYIPQRAWGYLNDSLLTPLPALYPTTHLATLSIYLASLDKNLKLPETWWELFDVSEELELKEMSKILKSIYPSQNINMNENDDEKNDGEEKDKVGSKFNSKEKDSNLSEDDEIWIRVGRLPVTKEGLREFLVANSN